MASINWSFHTKSIKCLTAKRFSKKRRVTTVLPKIAMLLDLTKLAINGTASFKNCLNTYIYAYLRDIWWSKFYSIFKCSSFFSPPVLIRHLRQLKTVVFLQWFIKYAVLLLVVQTELKREQVYRYGSHSCSTTCIQNYKKRKEKTWHKRSSKSKVFSFIDIIHEKTVNGPSNSARQSVNVYSEPIHSSTNLDKSGNWVITKVKR